MKISSSYLFDSALRNLQSSQTDVARSREQLASGKNLVRASDDTSKLRSIETLESYLKKLDSFDSNLSYLKDRLNLEEGVLGSASDILMRIKELSIQAANDTMSSTDLDIIATEARNLREELFSIANTPTTLSLFFRYKLAFNICGVILIESLRTKAVMLSKFESVLIPKEYFIPLPITTLFISLSYTTKFPSVKLLITLP